MKGYLSIIAISLALVLVKCEPPPEVKEMLEECEKEVGVTKDLVHGPEHSDDPKVKCFHACMMKKKGEMVDGKVNEEKAIEAMSKHGHGEPNKEVVAECATKANEEKDECEIAGAFHKCMMEQHPH